MTTTVAILVTVVNLNPYGVARMTISITIPNEPAAIAAAGAFFAALQGASKWQDNHPTIVEGLAAAGALEPTVPRQTASAAEPEADGEPDRVDTKGVPFNADFCANAADPFYGSSARLGQWKKRKGVDDKAYDSWYDNALQDLAPAGVVRTEDDTPPPAANTAAAFGAAASTQPTAPAAPKTAGEFMGWVAEQQAANLLAQAQIQAAYQMAGLQIADLFGADAAVVARNVATLYTILTQPGA